MVDNGDPDEHSSPGGTLPLKKWAADLAWLADADRDMAEERVDRRGGQAEGLRRPRGGATRRRHDRRRGGAGRRDGRARAHRLLRQGPGPREVGPIEGCFPSDVLRGPAPAPVQQRLHALAARKLRSYAAPLDADRAREVEEFESNLANLAPDASEAAQVKDERPIRTSRSRIAICAL